MAGNTFGQLFRITTAGESHGPCNVVIIDGVPPGIPLSVEDMMVDLNRRRPGQSKITTQRDEPDTPEILSGVFEGKTTGTSLAITRRLLVREETFAAAIAALLAATLLWAAPPGVDWAAHSYQTTFLVEHGFAIWNNFWYAGRYSFVTYSVLYYPLAGLLGIKILALASIATAALAFTVILEREWGPSARASSLAFAVVWAGTALSAAFPFALGAALMLLALWALQQGRRGRFAVLAVLTLAASPLAFVILTVFLAAIGLARISNPSRLVIPAVVVVGAGLVEVVLFRVFRRHRNTGKRRLHFVCARGKSCDDPSSRVLYQMNTHACAPPFSA